MISLLVRLSASLSVCLSTYLSACVFNCPFCPSVSVYTFASKYICPLFQLLHRKIFIVIMKLSLKHVYFSFVRSAQKGQNSDYTGYPQRDARGKRGKFAVESAMDRGGISQQVQVSLLNNRVLVSSCDCLQWTALIVKSVML